jgi:ribosomal protein L24E
MNSWSESENGAPGSQIESHAPVQDDPLAVSRTRKEPFENQPAGAVHGANGAQQKCFVCHKNIADDRWFCRVPRDGRRIVLCSTKCALRYFDTEQPNTDPNSGQGHGK